MRTSETEVTSDTSQMASILSRNIGSRVAEACRDPIQSFVYFVPGQPTAWRNDGIGVTTPPRMQTDVGGNNGAGMQA